jgi:cytochrome c oxidase cbb3-type subunit I/II
MYAIAMWVSGVTQGLMWRAVTPEGALQYPNFVETMPVVMVMYSMRLIGGLMYLTGFALMIWNLVVTMKSGTLQETTVEVEEPDFSDDVPATGIIFGKPMILAVVTIALTLAFIYVEGNIVLLVGALLVGTFFAAWAFFGKKTKYEGAHNYHRLLEGRPLIFTVIVLLGILIGGVAELVPTLFTKNAVPITGPVATPYQPLELHGRDIYVREGCYTCHSQMIRPFRDEKMRYGDPSTAHEFIYDHPFQWGSKRTGPDLHRVGGKYPNSWHYQHLMDPRATSPGSNMPAYTWLAKNKVDMQDTVLKVKAMKTLGVPYSANEVSSAAKNAESMAKEIAADLKAQGDEVSWDSEMVALIAYLQRLGLHPAHASQNTKVAPTAAGGR